MYDGEHSYENQLEGLRITEPFFAGDCIILVDDNNWEEPWQATMDFINSSSHRYQILLDKKTCCSGHITFWNGIIVLKKN